MISELSHMYSDLLYLSSTIHWKKLERMVSASLVILLKSVCGKTNHIESPPTRMNIKKVNTLISSKYISCVNHVLLTYYSFVRKFVAVRSKTTGLFSRLSEKCIKYVDFATSVQSSKTRNLRPKLKRFLSKRIQNYNWSMSILPLIKIISERNLPEDRALKQSSMVPILLSLVTLLANESESDLGV